MNKEKMIKELGNILYDKEYDVLYENAIAAIAVDYMLEKFGPLVEAAKEDSHYYTDRYCTCTLCKAIKQLEEND